MPKLHQEFLAARVAIGVDEIESTLDRRFIEEYGEPWHEPPATDTRVGE